MESTLEARLAAPSALCAAPDGIETETVPVGTSAMTPNENSVGEICAKLATPPFVTTMPDAVKLAPTSAVNTALTGIGDTFDGLVADVDSVTAGPVRSGIVHGRTR